MILINFYDSYQSEFKGATQKHRFVLENDIIPSVACSYPPDTFDRNIAHP
jgi:hypothetical protein